MTKKTKKNPVELTPEQAAFKEKLIKLERAKDKAKKAYWDEKKKCKHVAEKHGDVAWCAVCDTDLGWHCPESPDGVCHYFTEEDGKSVSLMNGETTSVPDEDHCKSYETYDFCLFCGNPEERR